MTEASANPLADNQRLLQWQAANVLIGNCDGHAKNISLLRSKEGRWELTPFYDLVSTIFYPKLSKELAMGIGGLKDIGTILPVHWKRLAENIDVHWKTVESLALKMLEEFPKALATTHEKALKQYGEQRMFELLNAALKKHYEIPLKRWKTPVG